MTRCRVTRGKNVGREFPTFKMLELAPCCPLASVLEPSQKKCFEKFHFLIYRGLFNSQRGTSALLCSSSTLHLKGQITLFYIIVQIFFNFFSFNTGQSWSWSRSRPFFTAPVPAKKGGSGFTTLPLITTTTSPPSLPVIRLMCPCHPSPCLIVSLSPCLTVSLSPCLLVSLSPYLHVSRLPVCLHHCITVSYLSVSESYCLTSP